MKNNVCKFPAIEAGSELNVFRFVLETEKDIMSKSTKLEYNRMILFVNGDGECILSGVSYPFSAGTLIFGFEGEEMCLSESGDVGYIYIDFGGTRAHSLFLRFGISRSNRKKDNLNELIPFCTDSLLRTSPENIDIAAEIVLLYVLSRLSVGHLAQNNVLQRMVEITEENFRDPEFSMNLLAKEIGYNPKYLSHFFKKKMNVPYSEYLRSVRFKYAVSLIKLGLTSVKNVAFLSGFSDSLYFSKTFKKALGVSPTEFIRGVSENAEEGNSD